MVLPASPGEVGDRSLTPDTMADAPQVAYGDARPQLAYGDARPEVVPYQHAPQKQEVHAYYDETRGYNPNYAHVRAEHATILGIRRRNFWILVLIAVVVVGATVGGSVGGAMAVRDSGYVVMLVYRRDMD